MARMLPPPPTETITVQITSSRNWVVPNDVSKLSSVSGYGARGEDGTGGYYDPPITHTEYAAHVSHTGANFSNPSPGQLYWEQMQGIAADAATTLNRGGSGRFNRYNYFQYNNGYGVHVEFVTYSEAIPGSATTFTSSGWKSSGLVSVGDYAFSYVRWRQYGEYHPPTSPTQGSASSAFGRNFPGSVGNTLQTLTTYSDVTVTPGSTHYINVAPGGLIQITYTK